jgi:hypothetical protein
MALQMTAFAADLAAVQVTAIGVTDAVWLVVTIAALVAVMRRATAEFPLTRSARALPCSQFRNAREPRSDNR